MNPVLSTALSGLQAATNRVAVSANNIANALTSRPTTPGAPTPKGVFKAQEVTQRSVGGGGVATDVWDKNPATVTGADSSSPTGLSAFPNVDFVEEVVNQAVAVASYRANAAVIRTQQKLDDALLDIKT
jgi:flagellar basal-body rod protein FlgC